MKRQELKEKKEFCNLIVDIAKDVCKASNLCQITKKGCRRYTFEENPSLCCRFCKHLEIGVGCKVKALNCAMGACYSDWIQPRYLSSEALEFFGEEHLPTLLKLQLLKTIVEVNVGNVFYSRLSVDESFSKNANVYSRISTNRFFRGLERNNFGIKRNLSIKSK